MKSSIKIGSLEFSPNLVLAPMSGVTCSAFRRLIKELNPGAVGLVVSEFVSVEGMTRSSKRTLEMTKFHPSERPYGVQIFGYDPARMADAAKMMEDFGVDVVDINCGCPAPKVVKRGGGCELMRQPEHLEKIFRVVRKAVSLPLTMKMRSGWDEDSKNAVEVAKIAWQEGLDAVTVHGRTRSQLYRGLADWGVVAAVKNAVPIPVFGSGDVRGFESADRAFTFGADGIYIGRAAMENPVVFVDVMNRRPQARVHSLEFCLLVIARYVDLLQEDMPEKAIIGKVKQLASQFMRGHELRKVFLRLSNLAELKQILLQHEAPREVVQSRILTGETVTSI